MKHYLKQRIYMLEDNLNSLDDVELRNRAQITLVKFKEVEKQTKFHSERIGKNTVVFCKTKENIEKYKEQLKINSKSVVFKN